MKYDPDFGIVKMNYLVCFRQMMCDEHTYDYKAPTEWGSYRYWYMCITSFVAARASSRTEFALLAGVRHSHEFN